MRDGFLLVIVIVVAMWCTQAEATRQFTVTQINPAPGSAAFVMGTTNPVTFRVTNTSNGGNAGETITTVRFRVLGTYTTFSSTTAAPPGWTRTSFSATAVIFQANTPSDRIPSGSYKDFTLQLICGSTTADTTDMLRDVRATFSTGRNVLISSVGSWTILSLAMTLTPSTFSVGKGCQFTLTMSVTNRSTASITGVTSVPKPPSRSGVSATTTSNPANLNLGPGATGTMVWTYTAGNTSGTLRFTASARDSTGTRTASSVTTPDITVTVASCNFTATLANTGCVFSGETATFTMTVLSTGGSQTNVVPSALSRFGTSTIGTISGPSPASIALLPADTPRTFTWTAPVTGNIGDTYYVTGYATADGPIQTAIATSNTQTVKGYTISINPDTTTADCTTVDLTWTIANSGCANIDQVEIKFPAEWTLSDDAYAIVNNTEGTEVDSWKIDKTTFKAPTETDRIPNKNSTGSFSLLFSKTPASTGTYTFSVAITDDTPLFPITRILKTTVTVTPYNSAPGGPNETKAGIWQETVQ